MDRKNFRKKILNLCVLFFCVGLISFTSQKSANPQPKKYKLADFPNDLNGWIGRDSPVPEKVVEALKLDDLLSKFYQKRDQKVGVYIGYYYDSKKVGALHSPLVCFPGQGWDLFNDQSIKLRVGPQGKHLLNIRTMIARKGDMQELVLFWYQAYDKALSRTIYQKLTVARNKIFQNKGDSAFMRVMVPLDSDGENKALSTAKEFLEDYYPEFITFVKS